MILKKRKAGESLLYKKMYPAYRLDSINYLKIGELCEIEIIGNDASTNIEEIGLWQEHPVPIILNAGFDVVLIKSFTEYDCPEVWDDFADEITRVATLLKIDETVLLRLSNRQKLAQLP